MAHDHATFATRLAERPAVIVPGVFDALSATLAQRAGFEAVFLSGSALAYTQLGRPDVGLLTLTELVAVTTRVCDRVEIPVLVDADQGYGSAMNVYRTTRLLERAGAGAIQIEDRLESVAAGDIERRPLVDADLMVDKIRAALDARTSTETVISARTDGLYSCSPEETLDRAARYLDAGADMIFVEGCVTDDNRRRVADRFAGRVPLLFNAGIVDSAELPGRDEFEELGYSVILFPGAVVSAAVRAQQRALVELEAWKTGERNAIEPVSVIEAIESRDFLAKFSR
jgi:2-methylisocitrate lyase-like PEP mutase family enzyme